jgi:hypothetical protein
VPCVKTLPTVTLIPYSAARFAGRVMDPCVSVATASGVNPAANPAALPEDDPAGVYTHIVRFRSVDDGRS